MEIDILIPTYNGKKYIYQQIDSLLNQSYPHVNIIIKDDCSTDSTYEQLCKRYKMQSNITILQSITNVGYTQNFTDLIKIATGDIICLCDQDDIWDQNKVQTIIDNMQYDKPKMICHDVRVCDDEMNLISSTYTSTINSNHHLLRTLDWNGSQGSTICFNQPFKKEFLATLPSDIIYDAHLDILALALNCRQYINIPLQSYRRHDRNSTNLMYIRNEPTNEYSVANLIYSTPYIHQYITLLNKIKNKLDLQTQEVLKLFERIHKNIHKLHNYVTLDQSKLIKVTSDFNEAISFYNDFLDTLEK